MAVKGKRYNLPSGVREAYSILSGYINGDVEGAQVFLNSLQPTERLLRGRAEQKESPRQKMYSRGQPTLIKQAKLKRLGSYGAKG